MHLKEIGREKKQKKREKKYVGEGRSLGLGEFRLYQDEKEKNIIDKTILIVQNLTRGVNF